MRDDKKGRKRPIGELKEPRKQPGEKAGREPQASGADISGGPPAGDDLRHHRALEQLILSLSTDFINLESDLIDQGVNDALRKIGEFMGADRSYVFQFTGNGAFMSNTHEWCAAGVRAEIKGLQDIPVDAAMPWFSQRIKTQEVFHVPSVSDLPPEAAGEKKEFARQSIQSLICVPMIYRRGLIGFLGFDSVRSKRTWSDDAIVLLRIAGEMLANALMRKQSEDALRASEERFRLNFEQAAVGIVDCTLAGRYLRVNRCFSEITGYTGEELRSLTFREVSHPDDLEDELHAYAQVLQGRADSYVRQKRYLRKDGATAWVNVSLSLVRDAAGIPKRFVGVIEDISYRKRMEQDLLRAQKLESLGILAGGIAHDFNNTLTAIVGQITATRLKLQPGDPLGARLEEIEKATLHARTLTQQLLTFSRGGVPVKRTLSPERLVSYAANFVLSGTSVTHSLSCDERLWSIDADEGQMSQAFNNLLINACQAMPDSGNISIRMANVAIDRAGDLPLAAGNYVRLTIADNGVGILPEHLPRIFDPYFTTKKSGSGLGLAVSYSIVRNHGGHIQVESEPGSGTTVTIYLPASAQTAEDAPAAPDELVRGSGRVLFMDDEEMIREVSGEILGALGYEVEFAKEGSEAVALYRRAREQGRPFDAVIMDLTISGGMGGREAIQLLREYDPGVKAIVSSGYSNDPIMARFQDYGFHDVIVKPYKSSELSAKLHALVAGAHRER